MRLVCRAGKRAVAVVLPIVIAALHAPSALAQSDETRAAARSAATEGAHAMTEKRYAEAVDLFTRAEALVHAPPHLLYLARALAAQGQLVRAQETYVKITRETLAPTAPKAFRDAQESASKELPEIEKRIAYVKVVVEGNADAKVTMDGGALSSALVGLARPLDPGQHTLRADAEGLSSGDVTVNVEEGSRVTIALILKPIVAQAPAPATPAVTPPPEEAPPRSSGHGLRTAGFVTAGVGVVGLAVGTIFLLQNHSKRSDADDLCPNGVCPASKRADVQSLDSDADSAATLSLVGYVVGGVAAAAGVTMIVLDGTKSREAPGSSRPRITPWIGLRSVGLAGTF